MTGQVLLRALRGYRTALLSIAGAVLAFELLIALVWLSLGKEVSILLIEAVPSDMQELMERQFGFLPTGGLAGWLAALNRHPVYLILLSAFAIGAASAAAAREVERGSILLILARPLARWRFLLGKLSANALGLLGLAVLGLAGLYAGGRLVGDPLPMERFFWVAANGYLLFLSIAGLALLLSAAGDDGGAVAGRAAGLVLAAYFLDFLANLWSPAEPLGPLSLFHYYDSARIVRTGAVPWGDMAVLLLAALALHAAALAVFQRRDIAR